MRLSFELGKYAACLEVWVHDFLTNEHVLFHAFCMRNRNRHGFRAAWDGLALRWVHYQHGAWMLRGPIVRLM